MKHSTQEYQGYINTLRECIHATKGLWKDAEKQEGFEIIEEGIRVLEKSLHEPVCEVTEHNNVLKNTAYEINRLLMEIEDN